MINEKFVDKLTLLFSPTLITSACFYHMIRRFAKKILIFCQEKMFLTLSVLSNTTSETSLPFLWRSHAVNVNFQWCCHDVKFKGNDYFIEMLTLKIFGGGGMTEKSRMNFQTIGSISFIWLFTCESVKHVFYLCIKT